MTHAGRRAVFRTVVLSFAMLASSLAHAQADGPRAFQVIPAEARVLSAYGMFLRGNQKADPGSVVKGGDIDVDLGVLQYTQAVGIAGKQSGLFAVLTFGEVSGRLKLPLGDIRGSSTGVGDLQRIGHHCSRETRPGLVRRCHADGIDVVGNRGQGRSRRFGRIALRDGG